MNGGTLTPKTPTGTKVQLTEGSAFRGFLDYVAPVEGRATLQENAHDILSKAMEAGPGSVGLVVGRVQSGKTLSYESVISLARDNEFGLVIVVSGISNPLLNQGIGRLTSDLRRADENGWTFINPADNSGPGDTWKNSLKRVQSSWTNSDAPANYRKTGILFVLKHHSRLRDVANACAQLDFGTVKTLIIDDEADQASLNSKMRKGEESPTYASLLKLRQSLANGHYLQYTATPQAPLLISIADVLSPSFVKVIEPGGDYVGGEDFFYPGSKFTEVLLDADPSETMAHNAPAPLSLRRSLQLFLIGATAPVVQNDPKVRSMLIHPSRETKGHEIYTRWVRQLLANWSAEIAETSDGADSPLRREFFEAWTDLAKTATSIPEFEQCWRRLGFVISGAHIVPMNAVSGQTPRIEWDSSVAYILVGGQAVDRGFTVEGLTVTYMPRGPGGWTADTLQQRARFFGYKRKYLGFCRILLDSDTEVAFTKYVDHEKLMLETLRDIDAARIDIRDWQRLFYLDRRFAPTRSSVIAKKMVRSKEEGKWIYDQFPVREDRDPNPLLRDRIFKLLPEEKFADAGHGNFVQYINPFDALQLLLDVMPTSATASPQFQGAELSLSTLNDNNPEAKVAVYWMRKDPETPSERTLDAVGRAEPFQGRSGRGSSSYLGDRKIFDSESAVTVQLHEFVAISPQNGSRDPVLTMAIRFLPNETDSWLLEIDEY